MATEKNVASSSSAYPLLFSPLKVGTQEVRNRVFMPPVSTNLADHGYVTDALIDHYASRAAGGVGLIVTEVVTVEPTYVYLPGDMCMADDSYVDGWTRLASAVHEHGAKILPQLFHPAYMAFPLPGTPQLIAPSAVGPYYAREAPRPVTREELKVIVRQFGDAAERMRRAGTDGVEIHAAHAHGLLGGFLSPLYNKRTDEYGNQSLENRCRFNLEVIREMRKNMPEDMPLLMRLDAIDEMLPAVTTQDETVQFINWAAEAGVDAIDLSRGNARSLATVYEVPPYNLEPGFNMENIAAIKARVNIPVIGVGRIVDPALADQLIREGKIDMVAVGRAQLADPEWCNKSKEGREAEIRRCIGCTEGCYDKVIDPKAKHITCTRNPALCLEYKGLPKPETAKNVMVIGAGIGGMECALVLKQRGHTPVIFEKTNELGGLFLTASAMSFKENDKELIEWYKKEVEKQGIDIRFNTEVTDLGTMRGFDEIIVATGSVPRTMPMIPGFEKTLSFTELLKDKKEVGDKVLFIGGGQSSCEAAYDLILQGKHPIIVEYAGDLVAAQATCLANTSFLRDAMEYHKVPTYLESTVTEIKDNGVTVKNVKTGETFFVECDDVVNGIGFVPAPVGEKGRHVHRVGDCVAIGNLRTVIWRAWDVCMKL